MIERMIDPPDGFSLVANCGHEVYRGEEYFTYEGGTFCPDCFDDLIAAMTRCDLAELLGADVDIVPTRYR